MITVAVAREYGFASRTRLRYEVAARTASLARQAEAFCEASIRDGTDRAARMLAATPELARYSFATAVILGDAGRLRTELGRDPGLATQADPRTGWVERLRAADPGLPGRIPAAQQAAAMIHAAESGNTAAITLLLDLGPLTPAVTTEVRPCTPPRTPAAPRRPPAARPRRRRRGPRHHLGQHPMKWAAIGSREQPASHPTPTGPAPCKPCSTLKRSSDVMWTWPRRAA